jgi:hypothetical protein
MPRYDRDHDLLVRILTDEGWNVRDEQYFLNYPGRRLWIDIYARNPSRNIGILVEVKGFANVQSPVEYLASVAGKYLIYREWLKSRVSKIHEMSWIVGKGLLVKLTTIPSINKELDGAS